MQIETIISSFFLFFCWQFPGKLPAGQITVAHLIAHFCIWFGFLGFKLCLYIC